ncbi:MAG: glycosyltransferase [Polyangiaceae bacterium]
MTDDAPRDGGVALCMPVLDDRDGIAGVLPRLARVLAGTPHTVAVVDGGSRDGTREWLAEWIGAHPECHLLDRPKTRPGCLRGDATRFGLRWLLDHGSHDVFVDIDADGAQPPEEIPGALAYLAAHPGCDVVVASKYAQGSVVTGRPWSRRVGSRVYSRVLRAGLGGSLRDYSNSYRFYRRAAAAMVARAPTRHDTPVFLAEMLATWLGAGLRIDEVPTRYEERDGGVSKVGLRDALRGFMGAVEVIVGARRGRYRPT